MIGEGDLQGLEMLAERGQWDECLSLAKQQSQEVLNTYLMKFSKTYLKQGQFKETARTMVRYDCPAIQ